VEDEFDEENIRALADELVAEIETAREERHGIDIDLKKWLAGTLMAGVGAGVATAHPFLFGAATAATAVSKAAAAWYKKHHFSHKLPAAFFLELEDGVYNGSLFGI